MPSVIRLVLFDIDGTLIRSGGAGVHAFGEAFTEVFQAPQATAAMKFAGRTDFSLAREGMKALDMDPKPEDFTRFFSSYTTFLRERLKDRPGSVCVGVQEFLAGLRQLRNPPLLGLLTGNIRLGAELKLRHYGLWEHFVFGAYADDHEDRNLIAKKAHERGREHLGPSLSGREILVIGDTPHDVTCGRAIGARVLAVATGGHTVEELAACQPDLVVEDLTKISAEQACS